MTVERIVAACEKARAKGYRVVPGTWGVGWNAKTNKWAPLKTARKCLCPIGALVLAEQPSVGRFHTVPEAAAVLLGVQASWMLDFQSVFDGVVAFGDEGASAARAVLHYLASSEKSGGALSS